MGDRDKNVTTTYWNNIKTYGMPHECTNNKLSKFTGIDSRSCCCVERSWISSEGFQGLLLISSHRLIALERLYPGT